MRPSTNPPHPALRRPWSPTCRWRTSSRRPGWPSGRWPTPTTRGAPRTSASCRATWTPGAIGSSTPTSWPGSARCPPRPPCSAAGQLTRGHRPDGHSGVGPRRRRGGDRPRCRRGGRVILSSLATCRLEDVAAAAPDAIRWMQVYIQRERARPRGARPSCHGTQLPRPGPHGRQSTADVTKNGSIDASTVTYGPAAKPAP